MKNVLFVGPDYKEHRGGIGAVLETYSANIRPFKFIPTYNNRSSLSRFILFIKAVFLLSWTLITDKDIEFVHIHNASKGSFIRKSIILLITKLCGKKAILHVHSAMFHVYYENAGILRPYIRFIFRRADAIITLSQKWNDYFGSTFKIKRLFILNNVIERPVHIRMPDPGSGPVKLLFLGIIGDRKGIFDLLKVLWMNKDVFSGQFTLTIGGNGEVERLKEAIRNNHLDKQVNFVGWIVGEQKRQLLDECDIYILPSYNEGLPISILEAMAHGKPIISTSIGGIPEIVHPGHNGWLFDPGNLNDLKSILSEVAGNKELLKEYGKNSYQLTEAYTPESVMRSLNSLYDTL
ncbi:MAG: glycosyltransferase family 4 protein [Chitinophagaceae bacterium]|nr:glycosyltransferase family 4 protein [Chitinophagaceae bacterium]